MPENVTVLFGSLQTARGSTDNNNRNNHPRAWYVPALRETELGRDMELPIRYEIPQKQFRPVLKILPERRYFGENVHATHFFGALHSHAVASDFCKYVRAFVTYIFFTQHITVKVMLCAIVDN